MGNGSKTILDLLAGKNMTVMTDVKVPVTLTIDSVHEIPHSRDLEASTPQNDWYPAQETWHTYKVVFTNGYAKEYSSISDIKID
jgi:hypothetical protein